MCIFDNHSVYVHGHLVLDNVMIAIEVVHHMKVSKRGKGKNVALKLDIRKAYACIG
uniref:Uncharacterized protein n=1 Tax=Medicago truncatula TaxID=3880 RepID=A2Q1R5_MEDTR|nr:hypothetical protein MtrDRAFT_AC149032g35v2 [Medicago truncatula]